MQRLCAHGAVGKLPRADSLKVFPIEPEDLAR
jgi:hypothetical protein